MSAHLQARDIRQQIFAALPKDGITSEAVAEAWAPEALRKDGANHLVQHPQIYLEQVQAAAPQIGLRFNPAQELRSGD